MVPISSLRRQVVAEPPSAVLSALEARFWELKLGAQVKEIRLRQPVCSGIPGTGSIAIFAALIFRPTIAESEGDGRPLFVAHNR